MQPSSALANLVLDRLQPAERDALTRLSLARAFDRPVFETLCHDLDISYERVIGLPVVERAGAGPERYRVADSVRLALREHATGEDERAWAERLVALHRESDPDEALYHEFAVDPDAAFERLRRLFDAADQRFDLARAHALVSLAEERSAHLSEPARAHVEALGRRLDARRMWAEERYSTVYYVERSSVVDALDDLLASTNHTWILHVHAPGGRGKSMFIDATISRRCAPDIPCVKLDFDQVLHVMAVRGESWRLLLAMAEQLATQLHEPALADLVSEYRDLAAPDAPDPGPRPTYARPSASADERDSLADEVTARFANMITDHIGTSPLVLLFDSQDQGFLASDADIERIADRLIRLHELVPGLRVILAGRTNLATRLLSLAQRLSDDARVVEIPPFSRAEAEIYLRERRGIERADLVDAIAEMADGDAIELALLADEAAADPSLDPAVMRAFARADLFYLVDRVLARLDDPRVRWLLRWAALTSRLEKPFFERVLWPLLSEQLAGTHIIDRPDTDPEPMAERRLFDPDPPGSTER